MGLLVDGQWHDEWYDTESNNGRFVRDASQFRNWVTPDGTVGPTGSGGFKAESSRYHLYVSYACPWAHRTLIFRKLKALEGHISVSVVNWIMAAQGWTFAEAPGVIADPVNRASYLHEVYTAANAHYSGRVTVPVLWDKQTRTIVNNESSEIIRMFNSAFDDLEGVKPLDLYPDELASDINRWNELIYPSINNGVYRAGFATTQQAYEEAVTKLFDALDELEQHLSASRYLVGDRITEADWRLFTTLVRFDPVYVGHFKTNLKRIVDFPNLWGYVRDLYQQPDVAETVNMQHIKGHYYESHRTINPAGVVPIGPDVDFGAPHDRNTMEDGHA